MNGKLHNRNWKDMLDVVLHIGTGFPICGEVPIRNDCIGKSECLYLNLIKFCAFLIGLLRSSCKSARLADQ